MLVVSARFLIDILLVIGAGYLSYMNICLSMGLINVLFTLN